MAIRGLSHVAISTSDLDRAVEFWCEAVGFTEVRRWSWDRLDVVDRLTDLEGSAARAVLLRGYGTGIEIFEFCSPPQRTDDSSTRPVSDHGYTHVCLEVDDIEDEMSRLGDAGMRFWADAATDPAGSRIVYGRDPDGNVIELHQPPREALP